MAVEQVARWPWNAWPDESGLGGRMVWNPQATIIGGLLFGLSRKTATEFSFFLAMPTIAGAAVYDLYKHHALFTGDDLPLLLTGFVAAFISALLAVKALLKFIAHHSYVVFGWYRIVFGGLILLTWQFGWVAWNGAATHGS